MTARLAASRFSWTIIVVTLFALFDAGRDNRCLAEGGGQSARTQERPLRAVIDEAIAARAAGEMAGRCADDEFVRRVYLDLAGRVPSAAEAREFVGDTSSDKRARLIAKLLESDEFPRRMQEAWTVMLLERREPQAVTDDAWRKYLQDGFARRVPWNLMIRNLLAADAANDDSRPGTRFFLDGGRNDSHQLTQDFARLLLGMNLQCAQCHDHPTIGDYKQSLYFGLYAFLRGSKSAQDKQSRTLLVDSPIQDKVDFVSVFMPDDKRRTGPRLLDGREVDIPVFDKGAEFAIPPQNGLPGVPKFRPRMILAEQLTGDSPQSRQFARNSVNRFWFLLMGRGLVHPLDLDHRDNPPSHPELLELMTSAFISHQYDVRWLVREIASSDAYQRSSRQASKGDSPTTVESAEDRYRTALLKPLAAEQLARSLALATGRLAHIDMGTPPEKPLTYKDYSNRKSPVPENWRDVLTVFSGAFGHPAGQAEVDFRPSIEQALFLSNDRLVRDWLEPAPGGLVALLTQLAGDREVINELTWTFYSRAATEEEFEVLGELLRMPDLSRAEALREACLAIVTSAEFRMNH